MSVKIDDYKKYMTSLIGRLRMYKLFGNITTVPGI